MSQIPLLRNKSLKIRDWTDPYLCDPKRTLQQLSMESIQTWKVWTHEGCVHNEVRSLGGRVLRQVPPPHPEAITSLSLQTTKLAKSLPSIVSPVEMDLLIGWFPQHKRALYSRELVSLSNYGLTKNDRRIGAFVKNEKLLIEEKDADPRMIQARTPRFNLELGQFTRAIEKGLYKLLDEETDVPMIAKGMNMRERAVALKTLWDSLENPVALSLDLSRWDMHVSPEMMAVAHQFYNQIIDDPWLREILSYQLQNTGFTAGGVKYAVKGNVMSGDMTTALGNCVMVVLVLRVIQDFLKRPGASEYSWMSRWRKSVEKLSRKCRKLRFLDDGDDHVVMCEKPAYPLLSEMLPMVWEHMGHKMTVDGMTEDFEQIMFCQHKPLYHHGMWEMMPNPLKVLGTAFCVTGDRCHNQSDKMKYLGTMWEARAILHQGQPVLGPLFHRLSKWNKQRLSSDNARRSMMAGMERMALADGRSTVEITDVEPETRAKVSSQWGLEVDLQHLIENNFLVSHSLLTEVTLHESLMKYLPEKIRLNPMGTSVASVGEIGGSALVQCVY